MNESDFDAVLYMDDPDFGQKLVEALKLKPGEEIQISTPQFERTDGRKIKYFPKTFEEYEFIREFTEENLKKIGCQVWEKTENTIHWLYPAEWYEHIPNGLDITDICGEKEFFEKGKTDDDRRFGALSFGFIQQR